MAGCSNPGPLPAGMPKSTVMMSPACMLLRRGKPDVDDGPLGTGRLMRSQLGTHAPLTFCPSETAQHLVEGDVLGSGKRTDLVTHRFRDSDGS